ncbi:MAG TPA: Sua5/YciO/YrdC/YwlC family protein [Solirubrobacteraceae bacterium]|nr:Sua5/YciO/YrdC/YwlC family protein [Solirubrobacteraceae bacterium]
MRDDARRLEECIAAGGVAIFPADTVYGLACDPEREDAVQRLYELKGRPPQRPAAVMFFALEAAFGALPELAPRERAAMRALLPGPLTLLLPNRANRYPLACAPGAGAADSHIPEAGGSVSGAVGETGVLGLRVPLLPERLATLRTVRRPVMQSSANISGEPEARRLADIPPAIMGSVDLILDGGELPGIASTVLDLREYERDGRWRIVREGPVEQAELEWALTEREAL